MPNCNEGQHLIGATQKCLMCHCPATCPDCGKLHALSLPVRSLVAQFLTNRRVERGLIHVTHYKKQILEVMVEMVEFILQGGPEVPPTTEEISCYYDRWIDYVRKQNGNGDAVESEA